MDVGAWLRELGLEQYEVAFREHAVDTEVLPTLTVTASKRWASSRSATADACWKRSLCCASRLRRLSLLPGFHRRGDRTRVFPRPSDRGCRTHRSATRKRKMCQHSGP